CMVLFQALLLTGYTYAHLLTSRLERRAQVTAHGLVVLVALAFLPVRGAPPRLGGEVSPVLWIVGVLGATAAVPFFVLATTGPLLQRWLASTDDPRGRDPYFLYAAGNLASFAALLASPFLLEPALPVASAASGWTQATLWTWAFVLYAALIIA